MSTETHSRREGGGKAIHVTPVLGTYFPPKGIANERSDLIYGEMSQKALRPFPGLLFKLTKKKKKKKALNLFLE